jgi:hypothetical protein
MIPLLINESNIFLNFTLWMSKRLAGSDLAVIGLTGIGPIRKISVLDCFAVLTYILYCIDRFDHTKANKLKLINNWCYNLNKHWLESLFDCRENACHCSKAFFFVEQVEDPAIYLSLYGFLWSFGYQYKVGKSSYSSFIGISIDDMIYIAEIESVQLLQLQSGIFIFVISDCIYSVL